MQNTSNPTFFFSYRSERKGHVSRFYSFTAYCLLNHLRISSLSICVFHESVFVTLTQVHYFLSDGTTSSVTPLNVSAFPSTHFNIKASDVETLLNWSFSCCLMYIRLPQPDLLLILRVDSLWSNNASQDIIRSNVRSPAFIVRHVM